MRALMQRFISIHPKTAHLNDGMRHLKASNPVAALRSFDVAIQLDKDYADAYAGRAIAYSLQAKRAQAIENLTNLFSLINTDANTLERIANLCVNYNCHYLAVIVYEKLQQLALKDKSGRGYQLWLNAGKAALELGKLLLAQDYFKLAAQHALTSDLKTEIQFYKGIAHVNNGEDATAKICFEDVLKLSQSASEKEFDGIRFESNLYLAQIHYRNRQDSSVYIENALKINPKSSKLHFLHAQLIKNKSSESLRKVWENPNAKYLFKLLCGAALAKHDVSFQPEFLAYYQHLSLPPLNKMRVEDICIVLIAAHQVNDTAKIAEILNESNLCLRTFLPLAVPLYLRNAFFDVLLSRAAWMVAKVFWEPGLGEVKDQYEHYATQSLLSVESKMNLAWQSIAPKTAIGRLMLIHQKLSPPSVLNPKSHIGKIAAYINDHSQIAKDGDKAQSVNDLTEATEEAIARILSTSEWWEKFPRLCRAKGPLVENFRNQTPEQTAKKINRSLMAPLIQGDVVMFDITTIATYFSSDNGLWDANFLSPQLAGRALYYASINDYKRARETIDEIKASSPDLLSQYAEFYLHCKNYRLAAYVYSSFNMQPKDVWNNRQAELYLNENSISDEHVKAGGDAYTTFFSALRYFHNQSMFEALVEFEKYLVMARTLSAGALEYTSKAHNHIALIFILEVNSSKDSLEKALKHLEQVSPNNQQDFLLAKLYKAIALINMQDESTAQINLIELANNKLASIPLQLLANAMLRKLNHPDHSQLTSLLENINWRHYHAVEDVCSIAFAYSQTKQHTAIVTSILGESSIAPNVLLLSELPAYLRQDYLDLLLDAKFFSKLSLEKTDLMFLKASKQQYVAEFVRHKDINIAIQALCGTSLLGQIFNIASSITAPSLTNKNSSKHNMAAHLNQLLWDKEIIFELSHSSKIALQLQAEKDPIFIPTLKQYFPALYEAVRDTVLKKSGTMFFNAGRESGRDDNDELAPSGPGQDL